MNSQQIKVKEVIDFFHKDSEHIHFFEAIKKGYDQEFGDFTLYYRDEKTLISLSVDRDSTMYFNYQQLNERLPEHSMCSLEDEDSKYIINVFYDYLVKFVVFL